MKLTSQFLDNLTDFYWKDKTSKEKEDRRQLMLEVLPVCLFVSADLITDFCNLDEEETNKLRTRINSFLSSKEELRQQIDKEKYQIEINI